MRVCLVCGLRVRRFRRCCRNCWAQYPSNAGKRSFQTDVHKGGFEPVFEVLDLAFEDAADEAFVAGAFDGEFLEFALFQHGDAGFERLGVDDDFLVEFLDRLDESLDFFDDPVGDDLDGVHQA